MESTPGSEAFSSLDELQRQLNEDFAQTIGPSVDTAVAAASDLAATTISTVVLQSGPLQLVVAILKSGEKLFIKVADLQPKFTFLGPSLDEALKLQNQHDELLQQIQNLPTPLEEFYRKIQEKISTNERPNPTLIEEMASSLNAVWHDIKKMLAERREIVALNVSFFERLGEAYGKMSSLEVACNDTMIPIEIEAVREFLDSFRNLRGDMLNTISHALTAGNQILDRLRVLSEIGTLDSRPNHIKLDAIQAIGQVETWLEDLSNRRNQLEQAWISRKTQLEQCLTLAILAKELDEIEQCLTRVRSQNLSSFTLGESAEQAGDLLETYQNLKPEAAMLRDKTLKITKATEELLTTGCFAGDEACAKAYSVLNACSEHLEEIDNRETLLGTSREFFGRAETILKRLDQLEIEFSNAQMIPSSPNDLPVHQRLLQDIRESIGEVLQKGYSLVDDVGRTKPEVAGVQATIERIEQRKLNFERYCNEESERNVRASQALNEFLERYSQLFVWLEEAFTERIVGGKAIHYMGENLVEAKECLLLHHQFLNDLEIKGNAINNLLVRLTPCLEHLSDVQRDDVQRKIDLIRQKWIELKNYVIERVDRLKLYIKFHQEAETLRNQFDACAIQFATFKDNPADHSLILAATANIRLTHESLRAIGAQFVEQLEQIGADPYLQKSRAAQCVERTLAEFNDRQLAISNEWESWNSRRRTETTLKEIMAANMETLAVTTKLEEQLYPIFSTALDNPTDLMEFIVRKRVTVQNDIQAAETDLTTRFDTIDQLESSSSPSVVEDIVAVKNNLNSIKTKLHTMAADFRELTVSIEQFLMSIVQCRDSIKEYFANKQTVTDPGSVEAIADSYEQFKQTTMEHFRSLLQQSEQIIERVKSQEPPGAKEMDTDKIITLLENLRTYFESQTESENCELKKQHNVIAFDRDLNEVRGAIREAGQSLEAQRGQFGENVAEAQTARLAFEEYAAALQELEHRVDTFTNSGTELVRQYPETSPYVESETNKIRNEWMELMNKIDEHRKLFGTVIEYFEKLASIEDNYRNLNADLINANNKLTILNNVDVANDLVAQVDSTIRSHEAKQLDSLKNVSLLSTLLYGFDKTVTIYTENTKLFQTFYKIKTEVYDRTKELMEQQQLREQQQRLEQEQRELEQQRFDQQQRELEQQQIELEQKHLEQQRFEQQQRDLEEQRLEQQKREIQQQQQDLERKRLEQEQRELQQQQQQRDLEEQRIEQQKRELEAQQRDLEQQRFEQERLLQQQRELEQQHAPTVVENVKITTTTSQLGSLPQQQLPASFDVQTVDEQQYLKEPQIPLVIQTVEEQIHEQIHEVITTTSTMKNISEPQGIPEQHEPLSEATLRVVQPLADVCVQEGQRVRLQCVVAGTPDPCIEWYKNGISVQDNPDYRTSFDPSSGVCTLVIDETVTADSADILCRATNNAGVADTSARLLVSEVLPAPKPEGTAPTFTMPLLDGGMAQEGQPFQYDCVVTGVPSPTVHWFKGDRCIDGSSDYRQSYEPVSGVASLRIEQVYLEDQTHYTCRAVNECGSSETIAFLTVKPLEPTEFPEFAEPLSNVMARVGQKIRLEAQVTGTPQPDLMWTHDGKHFTNREVKFFYENGRAQLVIDEAFLKDAGIYTLTAKNIAGEQCCSCNVVVKGRLPNETSDSELASDMEPVKPAIQLQLRDVSVFEGKPVRLDCVIVGQPEPEVIWYHGERPVKESTDFQLLFQGDRCSLVIREAFLEDAGEYRVVAINSAGEASSKCTVLVTPLNTAEPAVRQPAERVLPAVGAPPRFERLLSDILADEGEKVQFECAVSGDPRPNIRWYVNNREIGTDTPRVHCVVREDGVVKLIIEQVLPDDKGVYTVKALNPSGEAKCFSNLIVKSINAPEFETVPAFLTESQICPTFKELFADRVVRLHEPTKFECIVIGKPQPKIRWFFNDQPVQGHDFLVSTSGDRQVLTIPEVRPELTGKITCYADNEAGNAQCVAILQLLEQLGGGPAGGPTATVAPLVTEESMRQVDTTGSSCVTLQKHITTSSSTSTSSFASSSSTVVQQNGVSQSEVHSESAKLDRSFKQIGDQAPEIAEAKQFQKFDQFNDQPPAIQQESSFLSIANNSSAEMHETIIANSGQISTGKPARRSTAPRFVTPFNGKIVDQGVDVVIEGIVDGYPSPEVKITKNDIELQPDGDRIQVAYSLNKIVVELKNVSPLDAGRYTATASNAAGACSSTADLVVKKSIFPPVFGRRLQAQTASRGDRVVLDIEVTGTPEPTVSWFKDERAIQEVLAPGSYHLQQVGPCFKLIFEQVTPLETGKYMVLAKNAGGEAQSIADIVILECESQVPNPQPAPQKHVSFVDMVQQQQPKSGEAFDSSASGFSAHQEYASEAKLHGPTTESTIITETRRTTEATMRMEHKINFPDLPPVRLSQRTQTPTILVSEGTTMTDLQQQQQQQPPPKHTGTNTEPIATRTDATQTTNIVKPTLTQEPTPAPVAAAVVDPQPPTVSARVVDQFESRQESSSSHSSRSSTFADRPKSFTQLQPSTFDLTAQLPIYQAPQQVPGQQPAQMYSSFSSTQQFQASSTLSQQQYSQSAMQYQPFKPEPVMAEPQQPQPASYPSSVPTYVPAQPAAPQSFPPKVTPFKPTAAPAVFTPAPVAAPAPVLAPAPVVAPGPVQPVPHHTLATGPVATPNLLAGPSYNQTPQPFKPLPPPSITLSSLAAAPAPLESSFPQPAFAPTPQPAPYVAPVQTGPVSLPPYQEPLSFTAQQPSVIEPLYPGQPIYQPASQQAPPQQPPYQYQQQQQQHQLQFQQQQQQQQQVYQQQQQQYYAEQQEEVYKKMSVKETKKLFEETLMQQQQQMQQQQVSYGELKAPRMVQATARPPVSSVPLPADFGYGAIAELGLEPGPQPTMGYAPKASSERKSSYYREQIEQSLLESMDKEPERVPAGGVKIIPPSPRKKSKPSSVAPAGQSDTGSIAGAPAPFEQPQESQQGQGKPAPTAAAKSPFTESEYESDLDGGRKLNGYLADTEEVQKSAASFSSSTTTMSEQKQEQQQSVESFSSSSSKLETSSTVVSSNEVVQQQVATASEQQQSQDKSGQQQQPEQPVAGQTSTVEEQTLQQHKSEEVIISSSSETVHKVESVEETAKNFLVNNDLPEDLQPVKVLPTEEPLPTLKKVPVPAAVQPVPQPVVVAPFVEEQPAVVPPIQEPVVQNGYASAAETSPPTGGVWHPPQDVPAAEAATGYKPVHPVFAPPCATKQESLGSVAAPPPSVFDPIDKIQSNQNLPTDIPKIEKPKAISYIQQQQQQQQQSSLYQQQTSSYQQQTSSYQQQLYQQPQLQQSFPPAVQSVPAQYYTSVTAQPVHNTIATETSNSLQMKEMTESSNRVLNMQQTKRVVTLEQQQQQQQQQFMQKPGRFTPGEFRDSDGYDSDGSRIRPLWTPHPSDSDEPHYRSVRPNFQQHPRSTSLPRQYERIQTPMEFDTLPVQMPTKIDVSASGVESNQQRSSSVSQQTFESSTMSTMTTQTMHKTQTLDRYSSASSKRLATTPVPTTRDDMAVKAHRVTPVSYIQKQAQSQADSMAQTFKTKAYHFSNEVMTDIKKTPIKPILKNAYGAVPYSAPPQQSVQQVIPQQQQQQQQQPPSAPQAYREESRVSQYDPTAQGLNRSTTSTPNVKHPEEGVPTKTPLFVAPLKDIAVVSGQPARFECIVACDATPSIRWTKDEAPIEDGYKYVPEYRNGVCRLSLPVAYEADAGRYSCLAENHLGYAATSAELRVANSDWRSN
ncbi:titin isoform X3 [Anopheles darlingi]|uniref:titin isoform X3 n=1 Tax=Anopheles darlingi TaxID=43151 RepID=UPI00210065F9|nr:titin isoform X3 [Anopheles darlingi]